MTGEQYIQELRIKTTDHEVLKNRDYRLNNRMQKIDYTILSQSITFFVIVFDKIDIECMK